MLMLLLISSYAEKIKSLLKCWKITSQLLVTAAYIINQLIVAYLLSLFMLPLRVMLVI